MNLLWSLLGTIINDLTNFLVQHNGLSQQEAFQVSVELVLAFSVTFTFLISASAPVSRKPLSFLIAVMWILILFAIW